MKQKVKENIRFLVISPNGEVEEKKSEVNEFMNSLNKSIGEIEICEIKGEKITIVNIYVPYMSYSILLGENKTSLQESVDNKFIENNKKYFNIN